MQGVLDWAGVDSHRRHRLSFSHSKRWEVRTYWFLFIYLSNQVPNLDARFSELVCLFRDFVEVLTLIIPLSRLSSYWRNVVVKVCVINAGHRRHSRNHSLLLSSSKGRWIDHLESITNHLVGNNVLTRTGQLEPSSALSRSAILDLNPGIIRKRNLLLY